MKSSFQQTDRVNGQGTYSTSSLGINHDLRETRAAGERAGGLDGSARVGRRWAGAQPNDFVAMPRATINPTTGSRSSGPVHVGQRNAVPPRITGPRTSDAFIQENGAHERMHRTLKRQAIKPVRGTCAAQQRNFAAFRHSRNEGELDPRGGGNAAWIGRRCASAVWSLSSLLADVSVQSSADCHVYPMTHRKQGSRCESDHTAKAGVQQCIGQSVGEPATHTARWVAECVTGRCANASPDHRPAPTSRRSRRTTRGNFK